MNDGTVNYQMLTVEHWRDRFEEARKRFPSLAVIADEIAPLDPQFAHGTGYIRLKNIKDRRGGLEITARAVELMDRVRPPQPGIKVKKDRLSRQGIVRKPH